MLRQTVMCSSEKTKASPQNLRWVNRIIMVLRMIMLTALPPSPQSLALQNIFV